MISLNLIFQIIVALDNYKKKGWRRRLQEVLICLFFLRPIVDAYRIGTHHQDDDTVLDALNESYATTATEIVTESIPGCVLQIYVWLTRPEEAGTFALVSIGLSALTTGYAAAILSFSMDVDAVNRKKQPTFYGYVPEYQHLRSRCFNLMTIICTLHNACRCLGCALLAASFTNTSSTFYCLGAEMGIYLVYKISRRDFLIAVEDKKGASAVFFSFIYRVGIIKVVADFSGSLHFRNVKVRSEATSDGR